MVFLDINTFYCPRAGGIKTYHKSKLLYFKKHPEHIYYLVYPGERRTSAQPSPNIFLEQVFGFRLTGHKDGYRLMLDYASVFSLIRRVRPDVIEAGDP